MSFSAHERSLLVLQSLADHLAHPDHQEVTAKRAFGFARHFQDGREVTMEPVISDLRFTIELLEKRE